MEASNATPKIRADNMPEPLQRILKEVVDKKELAERVHRPYREKWTEYNKLYRSYRKLRAAVNQERDRDAVLLDAKREWGAELFIPYAFSSVETIVPRVLSNDPQMIVRPRSPQSREAAIRVKELIEAQQAEISYDLKLQPTARRGLIYGLGVQMTFWERKERTMMRTVPSAANPVEYAAREMPQVLYEGPQVESVDPFHFFWQPSATTMEECEWAIRRSYRSYEHVKNRVESGDWLPIDLEEIKGKGTQNDYGTTLGERQEAAGLTGAGGVGSTNDFGLHEIWEYHDRTHVYTILDQRLVVQAEVTPFYHRDLPFQIYRPTPVPDEFVGIGEIEPIVHLQAELNTLRSQRRDNATMVLQKAFAYSNGLVDPNDLVLGPGVGIPTQGAPRDVLMPIDIGEIPGSSYNEENVLKEDIERTTGVSDALAGGSSGGTAASETATGIQLVQQAATVRIRLKTKNLERETIRPAARQFLELNRQHVLVPKGVRVEDSQDPEGFRFTEVGPQHLNSDIDDPLPDAGSTEPDNPALRQDGAIRLYNQLVSNPTTDQRELALHLLKEFDIKDGDRFLIPEVPHVDPRLMGQVFAQLGVPPEVVEQGVMLTMQAQQDADAVERGDSSPDDPVPEEEPE